MGLRRDLSYFDLMNIVIGAIVGSDIYIVPGITAGLIGPFAIVVWIVGGVVAMVLAMVFGYCAYYVPKVAGSVLVLLGVPVYLFFSKTSPRELEGRIVSEEEVFGRELQRQHAFLANFVRMARAMRKRLARRPKA